MVALAGLFPAAAVEPFVPSPAPVLPSTMRPGIAFGSDWIAYERSDSSVGIANRATSQEILSIPSPAQNEPVEGRPGDTRTVAAFGSIMAAEGDRLAVLCRSRIGTSDWGYSLTLWEIPTGRRIGIVDLIPSGIESDPFVGIAEGRVVFTGARTRTIRSWSAVDLSPYPDLVIPTALPAPIPKSYKNDPNIALGGHHLVYRTSDSSSPEGKFVVADLEKRKVKTLAGIPATTVTDQFCVGRNRLIIVGRDDLTPILIHHDLDTATLGTVDKLDEPPNAYTPLLPLISPEGTWHSYARDGNGIFRLASGSISNTNAAKVIGLEWLSHDPGEPVAVVDGTLWFRPLNLATRETVAMLLPIGGIPETALDLKPQAAYESDGLLKVRVTATPAPTAPVSFHLTTEDGSALAGSDYTALAQSFILPAGSGTMEITIPLIQDRVIERGEAFQLRLSDVSTHALVVRERVPCSILASTFHMLPPVAPFTENPSVAAADLALTGGYLVQVNRANFPMADAPAVLRKPFDSGSWVPNASWGRSIPDWTEWVSIQGASDGRALIREYDTVSVYEPATDQVIYRYTGSPVLTYQDAITSDRITTGLGATTYREHFFDPAQPIREIPREVGSTQNAIAYTTNFIVQSDGYGRYSLLSRITGSRVDRLNGPANLDTNAIASDGNLVVALCSGRVFLCDPEAGDRTFRELLPPEGRFNYARAVKAADGLIFITEQPIEGLGFIRIFEAATGADQGRLFDDYQATRLPGASAYDDSTGWQWGFQLQGLQIEGDHAALLCQRTVTSYAVDHSVLRFAKSATLPGLEPAATLVEGEALSLHFTEAVDYPVTVSARVIVEGYTEPEDWMEPGEPVIVPAGTTSFATNLRSYGDALTEYASSAVIEVSLTANGITQLRRVVASVTDNDRMLLADFPSTVIHDSWNTQPMGNGWITWGDYYGGAYFGWTGNPGLIIAKKKPPGSTTYYGTEYHASSPWLVVSEFKYAKQRMSNQRLLVYRPQSGASLVRTIKRPANSLEQVMHIRGDTLWATSPRKTGPLPKNSGTGIIHEYGLPKGKTLRTYLAPQPAGNHFGKTLVADDQFLWVGEPAYHTDYDDDAAVTYPYPVASRVLQYSRATGAMVRQIPSPDGNASGNFGGRILATGDLLVTSWTRVTQDGNSSRVSAFNPANGDLLWELSPPQKWGSPLPIACLDGRILAIGHDAVSLYRMIPGGDPEFIMELAQAPGAIGSIASLSFNGNRLAVGMETGGTRDYDLTSLVATPPPPIQGALQSEMSGTGIHFERQPGGWTMHFGTDVPLDELPGTKLTLESSTDLTEWEAIARYYDFPGWVTAPAVNWLTTGEGTSLKIQREDTVRYFRLRLEPLPPGDQ